MIPLVFKGRPEEGTSSADIEESTMVAGTKCAQDLRQALCLTCDHSLVSEGEREQVSLRGSKELVDLGHRSCWA